MSYQSKTLSRLIQEILERKRENHTWQEIADFYGVSRALIWRIVNQNYTPKDREIRKKLGLKDMRHRGTIEFKTQEEFDYFLSPPMDERRRRVLGEWKGE